MSLNTLSIDIENTLSPQLIDRGLIKISGEAAEKFLQGQLTCDVKRVKENLPTEQLYLGAHCNVKGRIIFTFRIFYSDESYFLSLPTSQVEYAIQSLKKYAMFSKVVIEDVSELVSSAHITLFNPQQAIANLEKWNLIDIKAGIAEIYPETREKFTPHELNYHQLNAISFDKGCYIGQEIVARMHYLGKLKTTLALATLDSETPPQRGAKIFYGEPQNPQLGGHLIDFAKETEHLYRLLVVLYQHAQNQALWTDNNSSILVA